MKLIPFIFIALTAGCTFEKESPETLVQKLIEKENPVATDWIASFTNNQRKFKWYYAKEDYVELKELNSACNTWFEGLTPDTKSILITNFEEEAKAAALPNIVSLIEFNSEEKDVSRYIDYFTGSYEFFVNPSYKTKQYLLAKETNQTSLNEGRKLIQDMMGAEDKDSMFCFVFAPLFGAVGFEGFVKDTYDRLAKVISTQSRRELLEQAPNF